MDKKLEFLLKLLMSGGAQVSVKKISSPEELEELLSQMESGDFEPVNINTKPKKKTFKELINESR